MSLQSAELQAGEYFTLAYASQTGLDFTGNCSFTGAVKLTTFGTGNGLDLFERYGGSGGGRNWYLRSEDNGDLSFIYTADGNLPTTIVTFAGFFDTTNDLNTWVQFGVSVDVAGNTAIARRDGSSTVGSFSGSATSINNGNADLYISDTGGTLRQIAGRISMFRVFDNDLIAGELDTELENLTAQHSDCVADWGFDGDADDGTANSNDLSTGGGTISYVNDHPLTDISLYGDTEGTDYVVMTANSSKMVSSETDFAFPLDLSQIDSGDNFWTTVASDGADIRVFDSTGTTQYPVEVVNIDTTAKTGELHFKADTNSASDIDFRVYYNGTSAARDDDALYGQYEVWSDKAGVWHLGESSGGASDSTSNGNDLTDNNTVGSATGQIGGARDFEASNTEFLDIADGSQTGLDFGGDFRFTFWYQPETQPSDSNQCIVGKGFSGSDRSYLIRYADSSGQKSIEVIVSSTGSNTEILSVDISDLSTSVLSKITATWDASAATAEVFVNGVSQGTDTGTFTSLYNNTESFAIGIQNPDGSQINPVDGLVDEMIADTTIRSSDWETIEYNALSDQASFWTYNSLETLQASAGFFAIA